jgi:hypothetical protein
MLVRKKDGLIAEVCARDGQPHGVYLRTANGLYSSVNQIIDQFEVIP